MNQITIAECVHCGNTVTYDGTISCNRCTNGTKIQCKSCEEWTHREEVTLYDGKPFCIHCLCNAPDKARVSFNLS